MAIETEMKCVKCGEEGVKPSFEKGTHHASWDSRCPRRGDCCVNEHLCYRCRCGYRWATDTLDGRPTDD